jgi:hypothetical protein
VLDEILDEIVVFTADTDLHEQVSGEETAERKGWNARRN